MRALKLFRRVDDRPTLKDRAAALKARLARIARRPDDADPARRIMVAGSLAAAFPLPALAARAVPAGPHPDQAVLDAEAALLAAERSYYELREAASAAFDAVWSDLGVCPAELIAPDHISGALEWPGAPIELRRAWVFQWVRGSEADINHSSKAWTARGLRVAIRYAVPVLGRGGQTPHYIRHWRSLIPAAEAFDARRAEAEQRHRLEELREARKATSDAWFAASNALDSLPATTLAGLAAIARHVSDCGPQKMPANWRNLLVSAANVSGAELRKPDRAERLIPEY